jgi:hypothetical protein
MSRSTPSRFRRAIRGGFYLPGCSGILMRHGGLIAGLLQECDTVTLQLRNRLV